jgi:activator of HSP90 ATPase
MPYDLKFNVMYRVPVYLMFETLTNPAEITKFTQAPAKFEKEGDFNIYDGYITGTNVEIIENKKIVQKWKFNNWKDASELIWTFKEVNGNECQINVHFKNVPERDSFNNIVDLKEIEIGFRNSIFKKISDWLGYPQNKDKNDSSDDDD